MTHPPRLAMAKSMTVPEVSISAAERVIEKTVGAAEMSAVAEISSAVDGAEDVDTAVIAVIALAAAPPLG